MSCELLCWSSHRRGCRPKSQHQFKGKDFHLCPHFTWLIRLQTPTLHQTVDDMMCRDLMQRFTCRHDNLVWMRTTVFPDRKAVGERRRLRGRTIFCPREERRRTIVRTVDPQARCRGCAPLRVLGLTDLNILHNRIDNIFGPQYWSYTWRQRASQQQRSSRRH